MLNGAERMNAEELKADTDGDPSHFPLSQSHIQQPDWCGTVKAGKVPFYWH